ncbi:spermidine synthase [Nannochloropsis gaditana]|uniref:Spermidine synthase n=2 Tax=Nannochloropsis gaditana TaxID=72520 RepID=W7UA05_9STRA|nr:spermidine synthase [Nannochloropsis gaditana]
MAAGASDDRQELLNLIKDGWFEERQSFWTGQRFSLQVEKVLFHARSAYQDVLLFQSTSYGKVLVLDGVIQATERDEMAYQEMISHLPLFAHPNPRKVLIIGGGDGGVLREVAKHPSIDTIHMCEIDKMVIDVSKEFMSDTLATSYEDPRLTLVVDDAAKFVTQDGHCTYDCIIVDSSDPVGPAEALFEAAFFQSLHKALNPGGIICTQAECQWLHLDFISKVYRACCDIFTEVEYAYTAIPTYPSGQIGFMLLYKGPETSAAEDDGKCDDLRPLTSLRVAARTPSAEVQASLKFYNPALHTAAFALPEFARRKLDEARAQVKPRS